MIERDNVDSLIKMRDSEPYAKTVKSHLGGSSGMTDFKAPGENIDNALDAGGAPRCVTTRDAANNKYLVFFNTGEPPEDLAVLIGLGENKTKRADKIGLKGRGGMATIWHNEPNSYIAVASDQQSLTELHFACHDYANQIRTMDRAGEDLSSDLLKPTKRPWKRNDGGLSKETDQLLNTLSSMIATPEIQTEFMALVKLKAKGLIQIYRFEPLHPKYATFDKELQAAIPSFNLFHGEIMVNRNIDMRFELQNLPQQKGPNATARITLNKATAIDIMMGADYLTCRFDFAFFEERPVLKIMISNKAATLTPYTFYAVGDGKKMAYYEQFVEWEMAAHKGFCQMDVGYLDTEKETQQKKAFGAKAEALRGAWTFWNKRACGLPSSINSIIRARDAGGLRIATRVENNHFIITQVQHVCNDKSETNDDEVPYYFKEVRDLILGTIVELIKTQKPTEDKKQWSPVWNNEYRTAIIKALPLEGREEPKKTRAPRTKRNAEPLQQTDDTDLAAARLPRPVSNPIAVADQPDVVAIFGGHGGSKPLPPMDPIPEPPPTHRFTFSKETENQQMVVLFNGTTKITQIHCFGQPSHFIRELEAALHELGEARFTAWAKSIATVWSKARA